MHRPGCMFEQVTWTELQLKCIVHQPLLYDDYLWSSSKAGSAQEADPQPRCTTCETRDGAASIVAPAHSSICSCLH